MSTLDRVLDTRPFRISPPFRWLWVGTTATASGEQVALVGLLLQVWQLTGSSAWVGAIGLAHAVPMVGFALLGGSLADAVDRRRLVLAATVGGIATSALLAGQALAGTESLGLVLALVAAQAGCQAVSAPARRALVPRLLPADQVAAGVALTHLSFQAALLAGPAVGGLVAGGWGVAACYLLNAAAAGLALASVARLPALPPLGEIERPSLGSVFAGWRFAGRRPELRGAFLSDLAATLLAMPVALFPAVNAERFGDDPRTLGLLLSAIAVGGIGAGLLSGAATRYPRPGLVMLAAAGVWGLALVGFGLATPLWLALASLVVAGAADTLAVIARGTVVQLATPDSHRGRVSAADHIIGVAGPDVGNLRAGLVAGVTSAPVALVSGGLLCLAAVAAVAAGSRELRELTPGGAAPPAG